MNNTRKESLPQKVDKLGRQFTDLDRKVTKLDGKVNTLDIKVTKLDTKVAILDDKFNKLDRKVDKLDSKFTKKFDSLDKRLTSVEGKTDTLIIKVAGLEEEMKECVKRDEAIEWKNEILSAIDGIAKKFDTFEVELRSTQGNYSHITTQVEDHEHRIHVLEHKPAAS
jgi:chromosome segregation ATPase